jgi:minor extracellular serine protease Vpr
MSRSFRHAFVAAAVLLSACGGGGGPSTPIIEDLPAAASTRAAVAALNADRSAVQGVDSRLARARGAVDVWVALAQPSVAAFRAERMTALGVEGRARALSNSNGMRGLAMAHRQSLRGTQDSLSIQMQALGATELGRVAMAHNAIAVRVDASALKAIAALPGVLKVRPVLNYELALAETVPYIGAARVQAAGTDGSGVRVAVLDSGIDYTHKNFGGAGNNAAYEAAYGTATTDPRTTTRDGLFPTAKVVDGYDFVGESWGIVNGVVVGTRTEDDDPIDLEGHGTHVADIIAGASADGTHKGVAPGASLVAVKVCSAISSSCNGISLLKGMDFALDPNGDGDTSDAVDVVNMSLGSSYGQEQDDLSQASANAVNLGVVVVASAGNSANRPYITGSPSTTPGVISVAQTTVPSDKAYPLVVDSPASIAGSYVNTAVMDWAPVGAGFTGTVAVIGRGCPAAGTTPEDPYLDNPAGKVVLINRGSCAVSLKVDRAAKAGAVGVLLGLTAAGDAVQFGIGGGTLFVPTVVIQKSLADAIKANVAAPVNVTLSGTNGIALVGNMAGTSSRGPSFSASAIKPEIGAPGASKSAIAGGGDAEESFGGTSGAAPMVAGSAALLVQAFPTLAPEQIKALLMNSAETNVYNNSALLPGQLAPITRIGSGEVRVDRALALTSLARERQSKSAALSFGFQNVIAFGAAVKLVQVENLSDTEKTFTIQSSFRYANDAASGAVRIVAPPHVTVAARGKESVPVAIIIDGSKLPDWGLDGGLLGGDGSLLDNFEFDGYVTLTAGSEKLSLPWQVLPRKAAAMLSDNALVAAGKAIRLRNLGVAAGDFDVFSLTGVSPRAAASELPAPGDNFAFIDLRAVGVRLVQLAEKGHLQFAINTFGRRAHPNYPAEFDVYIDVDRDGVDDFAVYNAEQGGFAATGSNLVNVVNLRTGAGGAFFYNDADLQSANAIFTVPTEALGLADDATFDFRLEAVDNYFTGATTDGFGTMTYNGSKPKFVATGAAALSGVVPPRSSATLGTAAVPGGELASPSQTGLLLMYRLDAGREADIVRMR